MKDYCKSCTHDEDIGFCGKCFYSQILEERGIPPTEYKPNPKPITHGDQIRALSDEELADKFEKIQLSGAKAYGNDTFLLEGELKKYWLDWLRQEAKDA